MGVQNSKENNYMGPCMISSIKKDCVTLNKAVGVDGSTKEARKKLILARKSLRGL